MREKRADISPEHTPETEDTIEKCAEDTDTSTRKHVTRLDDDFTKWLADAAAAKTK